MAFANYTRFGGTHPETASLANVMACAGVTAPHTGQPYSEAMVLGVGGGLGAGYILWEFKEAVDRRVIVLGFIKDWQYPMRFMQTACERLGGKNLVLETGSAKAAAKQLDEALDDGKPAIAWVDRAHMPYLGLPEALKGHAWHFVVACGAEGENILIDDLARQPFVISRDTLAAARARISSTKNRLLLVEKNGQPVDLRAAVTMGVQDCIAHLSEKSDSFSLPAFRKWAKLATDTKNSKGWPVVFADGKGLYSTLQSIYESVGLDGGALRKLYADFLDEAAAIIDNPALAGVAACYREIAARWQALADVALPDSIDALRVTKALMQEKHTRLTAGGETAVPAVLPINQQLSALEARCNAVLPLDDTMSLFETIGRAIGDIYEAEMDALASLKAAVQAV